MRDRYLLVKLALFLIFALLIVFFYWRGAKVQQNEVNKYMGVSDQSAYMNYARNMAETHYSYVGGRNRMPLYPFVQSLFYRPELSDEAFFVQGKTINLVLSIFLLVGMAVIISSRLHRFLSLNLMLILMFTVFIFKAGFFQAELLFYFLNFCLFLLMWRMLKKPTWPVAILTGICAGLAHLTKASIIPGLLIFIASMALDWLIRINRESVTMESSLMIRSPLVYQPLFAAVTLITFLAVIFPYVQTSKQVFGQYFYNVNSTFYVWYDSWEEVSEGTKAHGDRVGWPDMPADEIPSLSKYLREHSIRQILERFWNGAILISSRAANSYGYLKYVILTAIWLVVSMVIYRRRTLQLVRANITLTIFLIVYFVAYFLLYAWYSPLVDGGNRLILAQFFPLMFTMVTALQQLLSGVSISGFSFQINALNLYNLVILSILLIDIPLILTGRISTIYGGH